MNCAACQQQIPRWPDVRSCPRRPDRWCRGPDGETVAPVPAPPISTDLLVTVPEELVKAARATHDEWATFSLNRQRGDGARETALREALRRAHTRIALHVIHANPAARIES